MKITKALITVAGKNQRDLPLQMLIDKDRSKKTILEILIQEIRKAGIEEIGIVINKEDQVRFNEVLSCSDISGIRFIPQMDKVGYGYAFLSASDFLNNKPFLHLVGDHLYIDSKGENSLVKLIQLAEKNNCSISTVQPTRENLIGNYGTVKAERIQGDSKIYKISGVCEKPTPTYAEQHLMVSGMRTGHYLCFHGMHIFTHEFLEYLKYQSEQNKNAPLGISEALNLLSKKSRYLALEQNYSRYDIGIKYGLLKAQVALSLSGKDREYILSELLQLLIDKDLN